jgi:hypothetical protein
VPVLAQGAQGSFSLSYDRSLPYYCMEGCIVGQERGTYILYYKTEENCPEEN